jgi:hypothetical protein
MRLAANDDIAATINRHSTNHRAADFIVGRAYHEGLVLLINRDRDAARTLRTWSVFVPAGIMASL